MAGDATVTLKRTNDKMKFTARRENGVQVEMDAAPPLGQGEDFSPGEMVLAAYGACAAMAVTSLLRDRMRVTVTGVTAQARGTAQEKHPKVYTQMALHLVITSPDATEEVVQKAIDVAEQKICPVWNMLKGNVAGVVTFSIVR